MASTYHAVMSTISSSKIWNIKMNSNYANVIWLDTSHAYWEAIKLRIWLLFKSILSWTMLNIILLAWSLGSDYLFNMYIWHLEMRLLVMRNLLTVEMIKKLKPPLKTIQLTKFSTLDLPYVNKVIMFQQVHLAFIICLKIAFLSHYYKNCTEYLC